MVAAAGSSTAGGSHRSGARPRRPPEDAAALPLLRTGAAETSALTAIASAGGAVVGIPFLSGIARCCASRLVRTFPGDWVRVVRV